MRSYILGTLSTIKEVYKLYDNDINDRDKLLDNDNKPLFEIMKKHNMLCSFVILFERAQQFVIIYFRNQIQKKKSQQYFIYIQKK